MLDKYSKWRKEHPRGWRIYRLWTVAYYVVFLCLTTWDHAVGWMVVALGLGFISIFAMHLPDPDDRRGNDDEKPEDPKTPWGDAVDRMIRQLQRLPV